MPLSLNILCRFERVVSVVMIARRLVLRIGAKVGFTFSGNLFGRIFQRWMWQGARGHHRQLSCLPHPL